MREYLNNLDSQIRDCETMLPDDSVDILGVIEKNAKDYTQEEKQEISNSLFDIAEGTRWRVCIPTCFIAVDISQTSDNMNRLLNIIYSKSDEIPADTLFALAAQCGARLFRFPVLMSLDNKYYSWLIFRKVISKFEEMLGEDVMAPVPREQRNEGLVFVFTSQYLSMTHGPTKTALDRCEVLIKKYHKKVMLINTAECLSQKGIISIRNVFEPMYYPELCELEQIEYRGVSIPFFQCNNDMPNVDVIRLILNLVKNKKPEYVINIGGNDVTSNLVASTIPAITVGLGPSDFTTTTAACQTISRAITENDYALLDRLDIPRWHLIPAVFTSSLLGQSMKLTREDIGVPQEAFLAGIVGARLTSDMSDDFLKMIAEAGEKYNVCYLVMGKFDYDDGVDRIFRKYPSLKDRLHYVGFVSDTLAYLELCDIYINPTRMGGGTAAIEALYKSCPVLTTNFGDTSTGVGSDFLTESYETMLELIGKYVNDDGYLKEMSVKAKERAMIMLDSSTNFSKIIDSFEKVIIDYQL